jgi:hypothetical protein
MRSLWIGLLVAASCGEAIEDVDPMLAQAAPTYERDIRPLYARHCVACHDAHGLRAGGVELDRYDNAHATRVKSACTSITPDLIEEYAEELLPYLGDPPQRAAVPCGDWEPLSMPAGAQPRLTRAEQLILVRWVATGALP